MFLKTLSCKATIFAFMLLFFFNTAKYNISYANESGGFICVISEKSEMSVWLDTVQCDKTYSIANINSLFGAEDKKFAIFIDYAYDNDKLYTIASKLSLQNEVNLYLSSMCFGSCSRLLVPSSSKAFLSDEAFIVLTDTMAPNISSYFRNDINIDRSEDGKLTIGIRGGVLESRDNYARNFRKFASEAELLMRRGMNVSHLTLYDSEEMRLYQTLSKKCKPMKNFGVVLTKEYLNTNIMLHNKEWSLPSAEKIAEVYFATFTEGALQYSYDERLFYEKRHGNKARSLCHEF